MLETGQKDGSVCHPTSVNKVQEMIPEIRVAKFQILFLLTFFIMMCYCTNEVEPEDYHDGQADGPFLRQQWHRRFTLLSKISNKEYDARMVNMAVGIVLESVDLDIPAYYQALYVSPEPLLSRRTAHWPRGTELKFQLPMPVINISINHRWIGVVY